MSGKRRICLNLEERIRVIQERDKGISGRKLAKLFKCGRTQINGIIKSRSDILKEWQNSGNCGAKRKRQEKYEDINAAVYEWYNIARSNNIPISGTLIKAKAFYIASLLGIEDFMASNGWLDSFRIRHSITFQGICCESGNASDEAFICDWKVRLPSIINNHKEHHIFSVDESVLFFRSLPSKLTLKTEQCKDEKLASERLTVCLCVSGDGQKEAPLVIGKSTRPRCFENVDLKKLGVSWHVNKKARMTSEIFVDWLRCFDRRMKIQRRKVLLFLDDAPCHMNQIMLDNVQLQFFPHITTSKLIPLDHGITQAFKLNYRKRMMKYLIARIDEAANASELAKKITVSDAVSWVLSAWKEIDQITVVRCFQICGFSDPVEDDIDDLLSDDMEALAQSAGFEYSQALTEEESRAECYDLGQRETDDATGTIVGDDEDSESEESNQERSLTARETLSVLEMCQKSLRSANYYHGDKMNKLFSELIDVFEKEIVDQKCRGVEQT